MSTGSEITKASLEKVFSYLPKKCMSIFAAGGAVVDFEKASDVDIWFGRGDQVKALEFLTKFPFVKQEGHQDYGQDVGTLVVGNAYDPLTNKIIQVMTTKYNNAIDLMKTFDISTHCWAYTSKGVFLHGDNYSFPDQPPKILKISKTTFSRYIKICTKYGHTPDPTVLQHIIEGAKVDIDVLLNDIPYTVIDWEKVKAVNTAKLKHINKQMYKTLYADDGLGQDGPVYDPKDDGDDVDVDDYDDDDIPF